MDTRSLPSKYADDFDAVKRDFAKLSDSAIEEMLKHRASSMIEKRLLGADSKLCVRVSTGEAVNGDIPTEMVVTPLLSNLTSKLEMVNGQFTAVQGYGSVFDVGYVLYDMYGPYLEFMDPTAFNKSLALERLQMSFLRSHEGLGLAHTIDPVSREMSGRMAVGVDTYGLGFGASLNSMESDSNELLEKMRTGSTSSQTSIGGVINDWQWNDDYTEITILEWSLSRGEISIVHAGANPAGWVGLVDNPNTDMAKAMAEIQEYRSNKPDILR